MTKTKEVALRTEGLTPEQIELVKRTVARGATDDELALFLYTANRIGLDPLTKQIHFIKRKVWNSKTKSYDEVGTTQTGIDGYRVVAQRNNLAGIDDAIYDNEEDVRPRKATVTVYKMMDGQRVPFTATARWTEYAATDRDGNPVAMWKKMPYLMLAKVAEALALRKAFPNDLSGLYTNEEMGQADANVIYPAEYDQSPIKADAIPTVTYDDHEDMVGDDPAPMPDVKFPSTKPPTKVDLQRREIKELVDGTVLTPLEQTEEAYKEYVKSQTGLALEVWNYAEIISRLKIV